MDDESTMSRRTRIRTLGAVAGGAALASRASRPPGRPQTGRGTERDHQPPRDFGPDAPPNVYFVDPDVITVDPSFNGLRQANAPIRRPPGVRGCRRSTGCGPLAHLFRLILSP
jgi:gluconolactonase